MTGKRSIGIASVSPMPSGMLADVEFNGVARQCRIVIAAPSSCIVEMREEPRPGTPAVIQMKTDREYVTVNGTITQRVDMGVPDGIHMLIVIPDSRVEQARWKLVKKAFDRLAHIVISARADLAANSQ